MKVLIDIPDIPKNDHQRWVLTHGGIALDGLTNGEVIQKMFKISDAHEGMSTMFAYTKDDRLLTADIAWWNGKWGDTDES